MKSILLGILFLCGVVCAFGQTLPVKDGLWETIIYDDDGKPSTRSLNCVTQKSFAEMLTKANTHPGCKVASQNITSHGMTVDISCSNRDIQMSVHSVLALMDSEHEQATTTMKMVYKSKSSETTAKSSGHFVKSDCGKLKPGDRPMIIEEKQ